MEKRSQGRGKGQPTPSSSQSERTMTTRYTRKKEEEKSWRKEEQSKRLRMHLDPQDGLNNDIIVLTEGTIRVPFEAEQKVKFEDEGLTTLEVETDSVQDTSHLATLQELVKIESPGALHSNIIVVKEELDIPNDSDLEKESGGVSNLLPEEPVSDTCDGVFAVEADFGTVQKENEELRKLLQERDLEIKRLQCQNEQLKLSSSNSCRQVSTGEDDVVSSMVTGGQSLTPSARASISGQCSTKARQVSPSTLTRFETLKKEMEQLGTLLAQKHAVKMTMMIRHHRGRIPRGTGASMDKTLVMENKTTYKTGSQLFPDVLKIIIHNEPTVENSVDWRTLMPLLSACRRVCKSWKESVDHILQQDSSHFDLGHSYCNMLQHKRDFTPCPLQISYHAFDNARWTNRLERILCHVGVNPSYNPIPSRHLFLYALLPGNLSLNNCGYDPVKWTKYCQTVASFLQQAGENVWHLTVQFYFHGEGELESTLQYYMEVYRCLSEWFYLLPNLRSLALKTKFGRSLPDKWLEALGKTSFPKFEHLETLAFGDMEETHLNYAILMNNRHVNRLALAPRSAPSSSPVCMKLDLPNLSTLKCSFVDARDWQQFVNLATWKLEDLCVQFSRNGCIPRPTAAEFAEGLAKFGSTLKSLTFNPSEIEMLTGKDLELDLPQLKSLHLATLVWYRPPKVRLASLESLESFSMKLSYIPSSRIQVPPQCINNQIINRDFYDNKEWMKLPRLRNVRISVKVIGRDRGERDVFVKRRQNMPSVIYNVPNRNNWWIKRLMGGPNEYDSSVLCVKSM